MSDNNVEMDRQPIVSIGLVAYNRASLLERAIESVLDQSYDNIELVISDDASTDETESVCRKFAQKDNRVRFIRQTSNIGMTANFVEVFKHSSGQFFMWLSDDDWMDKNYVARCLEELKRHPKYSLVCGKTEFYRNGVKVEREEVIDLEQRSASKRVVNYYRTVNSNVILYGLMRREQVEKTVYHNTFGADILVSASLAAMGKVKTLHDISFCYSMGGISHDVVKLATYYGFSLRQARNPYKVLMKKAFADILWVSPAYHSLRTFERILLACRVAWVIRERFTMPKWESRIRMKLRFRSRLIDLLKK